MHRPRFALVPDLALEELAAYHDDVVAALRLYFSPASPQYVSRFAGQKATDVTGELERRLTESDVRSALAVMTSLEAHFRTDFNTRCRRRLKDDLSVFFREIEKTRASSLRLDEDILEGWKRHSNAPAFLISQLRGALRFRHWLAHGRYWHPKLGNKYDFDGVYIMASAILSAFSFTI